MEQFKEPKNDLFLKNNVFYLYTDMSQPPLWLADLGEGFNIYYSYCCLYVLSDF